MKQPNCYRVVLPATESRNSARHGGDFVKVTPMRSSGGYGELFTLAFSMREVAAEFPQAISIEHFASGYALSGEEVPGYDSTVQDS